MKQITWDDYSKKLHSEVTIAEQKFILEKPVIHRLEPEQFETENTTVYSFPDRGEWATHYLNAKYRGNFAPQVARNMVLRYSKESETVLDPMCGSGTTLVECKLLKRKGIGIDINPEACYVALNRLDFGQHDNSIRVYQGDVRNLDIIENESIDLIITHPPYADILQYSDRKDDLSNFPVTQFTKELVPMAKELYRVLKPDHFCAVLIGDTRKSGKYIPISHYLMDTFFGQGFSLKEDIIKAQFNCKMTPYWKHLSKEKNFHLIMHEHLFVFRK